MQRLKRIKLGSEAAMLLMKVRSSLLSLLERDRRNVVLDDLLSGQRNDADLDVEIETALIDLVRSCAQPSAAWIVRPGRSRRCRGYARGGRSRGRDRRPGRRRSTA